MEETKETKKLSYEELENVAVQFQHKAMQLESQLRNVNIASLRLNYLFKVMENKAAFPEDFVTKCSQEIIDIITVEDNSEETKEQ